MSLSWASTGVAAVGLLTGLAATADAGPPFQPYPGQYHPFPGHHPGHFHTLPYPYPIHHHPPVFVPKPIYPQPIFVPGYPAYPGYPGAGCGPRPRYGVPYYGGYGRGFGVSTNDFSLWLGR